MIRLLRLFSAFRALEQDRDATVAGLRECVQELTTEKLLLQDRLDAVLQDRSNLWELTKDCINNERLSYQSHINLQWQKQGLPAPWPNSPGMPEGTTPATHQDPIPRRELPSEAMARKTRNFYSSVAASLNQ